MTGDGAVLDFCGSFADGDGIYDLTARVFKDTRMLLRTRILAPLGHHIALAKPTAPLVVKSSHAPLNTKRLNLSKWFGNRMSICGA
jgi:hypothetical protein